MKGYKKIIKEGYMQDLDRKVIPIITETVKQFNMSCFNCENHKIPRSMEPCLSCIDYSEWE